jgi:trimethylamine--corrinoid protein Co-methyltransferase
MRATSAWLSREEKESVVEQALRVLDEVGMRFKGSAVLAELAEAGCGVDADSGLVRLPPAVVRAAVEAAPRGFVMAGATPERDVTIGEGAGPFFCPSGCAAKMLDEETSERRPSTLDDVRRSAMLNEAASELDVMWTMVTANDVPLERRELVEYYIMLAHTTKHVVFVDCPTEVDAVRRIMEMLSGDLERFRSRPRITTLCTAASPLQVDGRVFDVHVAFARLGTPVKLYSMAIGGATAPVTLAGILVQSVAELLGMVTSMQIAVPGARVICCCGSGVLDMRYGTFALGSVEQTMTTSAAVEVVHSLDLPILVSAMSTDARHPGIHAGVEKALKALATCGAGPDLLSGWGMLDTSNMLFLPQIVIDNELARMVRRMVRGLDASEAAAGAGLIADVGPGGNFRAQKETARRGRAGEYLTPEVFLRPAYESWRSSGATEVDVARERMREMLAAQEEKGPCLDEDQLAELREICGVSEG